MIRRDLVLFGEGDRVPSDEWVIENRALALDESLLTGESVPVAKSETIAGVTAAVPQLGGEGLAYVF